MTWLLRVRRVVPPSLIVVLGVIGALSVASLGARPSGLQSSEGVPTQDAIEVGDARDYSGEIPAHISAVDGTATLQRDGRVEDAEENVILLAGDRLRTTRGRLEILFADGSAVAVDEQTTIDLLDDSLMRLLGGRVKLVVARATANIEYRIDTAAGSAMLRTPGEYRVAFLERRAQPEVDLTVLRGTAELLNDHGRTIVRAGTYAVANASQAPSLPYVANSASWTEFERWADDQRDVRLGVHSTRYLPSEVHYYAGAFDRYGDWNYEPTYGYVWYPRVVTSWRPYHHGKWSYHGRFGWLWNGVGRWAWPTHHYGRWGINSGRWYWIPDRRWGPAWVSWASAPGYLGWCPLGFNNRPVFALTTFSAHHHQPWFGWSILPSRHFGPNFAIGRHFVNPVAVPIATWSDFRTTVPTRPNLREDPAPIRSVGGFAVPRNGVGGRGRATGAAVSADTTRSGAGPIAGRAAGPGADVPSGSRSRLGSRSAESIPSGAASRAVPTNRSAIPVQSGSPAQLRSVPDNSSAYSVPRSGLAPRTRPLDETPAQDRVPTAIRRTRPSDGSNSSSGTGWPTRQASPPPERSIPAPSMRGPDRGGETPSGSRPSPGAVRRGPVGNGESRPSPAPTRSEPSRVGPRQGSSPPPSRSAPPPPRASGGEGSRQAPPSTSGNRGQASRRGGGL